MKSSRPLSSLRGLLLALILVASVLSAPGQPQAAADSRERAVRSDVHVIRASVNGERTILGLPEGTPVFSWGIAGSGVEAQSAYRILVRAVGETRKPAWDTGRVASARSTGVQYDGAALQSRARYSWRIRVWDQLGRPSPWAQGWWETGLPVDGWVGGWIARDLPEGAADAPLGDARTSRLRREFAVEGAVRSARLYASALGVYVPYVNGRRVGDEKLAPGWTDYRRRIQYQSYDVTRLIRSGKNAVGFGLAPGWFAGRVGETGRDTYGTVPAIRAQLEVTLRDGSVVVVPTDESWTTDQGPVLAADLQMGEYFDARLDDPTWTTSAFRGRWEPVVPAPAVPEGAANVVPQADQPVRVTHVMTPRTVRRLDDGSWIFDLGQNIVGVARIALEDQPRGQEITIRHAETVTPDGDPEYATLRAAASTDTYVAAGQEREVWAPDFTQHGFRYVVVSGAAGRLDRSSLRGEVWGSDLPRTGFFSSSSSLLNRIYSNTFWSQRSNFLSVPTDCPQRNERLGWTGDINMFAPTAALNMDIRRFLGDKWMADFRDNQTPDGRLSVVIPEQGGWTTTAGVDVVWSSAAITTPYVAWQTYADTAFIDENWDLMTRFIEFFADVAPTTIFGDWAPPPADVNGTNNPVGNVQLNTAVALAWYKHSLDMMAEMAAATGRPAEAAIYAARARAAKLEFQAAYTLPGGMVVVAGQEHQTISALAIDFDLLPPSAVRPAGRRLVALLRAGGDGWDITTGFAGFPRLLDALSESGQARAAYRMLAQRDYPSLGYEVAKGATTIWEFWNTVTPSGEIGDFDGSMNHYAYGSVVDWFYRKVAGLALDPERPGFQNTVFDPELGGGLDSASARIESVRGRVSSSWRIQGDMFAMTVRVPANSTGEVHLPTTSSEQVVSTLDDLEVLPSTAGEDAGELVVRVGPGVHRFEVPLPRRFTAGAARSPF